MIILSKHYLKRFRERIGHSKRIQELTEDAYLSGKVVDEAGKTRFAYRLKMKEIDNASTVRIYKNCAYWFDGEIAVTVYPLPQYMHGRI